MKWEIQVTAKQGNTRSRKILKAISQAGRILLLLLVPVAPTLHAGSLDSSIIGMFPKDVSELGYADLGQARQFSWFPQFEAQVVPVSLFEFEQFLATAQMRQTSPIDQVAWARISPTVLDPSGSAIASGGGQLVGVAIGHFDETAIQFFLKSQKITPVEIGDSALYPSATGSGANDVYFTVIDSDTIAFGPLNPLERILAIRRGAEENLLENEVMMALIGQANGDGVFWGVLNSTGAGQAIQQLVPEAAKFPQAHDLIAKMKALVITVKNPSDMHIDFKATSESADEAALLSQLVQVGLMYQRYESSQTNPDLAKILDGVQVTSSSNQLVLSMDLTDDQVLGLIVHNTFSSLI